MKELYFQKEAIEKVLRGLDRTADAVGGTLGPCGKNVFIDDIYTPKVTNDGATIARHVSFEDKLEDIGAYVIKNVSGQTNDNVGDGTTTTAVLTQSLVHECLNRNESPMEIMASVKEAGKKALEILKNKSVKLKKSDYEKVALISAENSELAKLITEIITKLGTAAVVNIEDSKTFNTEYEIVEGYSADVGFVSPYFMNSGSRAIFTDVPVFVASKRLANLMDIKPIIDKLAQAQISSCVFVCEEMDDSVLGVLVASKLKGLFTSVVIRATGEVLKDIAGATGATVISERSGVTFQTVSLDNLGKAKKVVSDAQKSIFLGDNVASKMYALELEEQAGREENRYVKERLLDRVAKLRGGIANLKIYAASDFEREYLKHKAEDGVKALQAAIEEGIVEGGGLSLWRLADEIGNNTIGEQILSRVLQAPFRKILFNAEKDYARIVVDMSNGNGYDAKTNSYVPMLEAGIIDPAKVERVALENSISAASTFITSFCYLVDKNTTSTPSN